MDIVTKIPLMGMDLQELKQVAEKVKLPAFAAKQIFAWLYQKHVDDINQMTNISQKGRQMLAQEYCVGMMPAVETKRSVDGTVKYLFPTLSGHTVESVYIPDKERGTLCVSCQVGCRMGCKFCMTGRQGFQGHLTVTDILNQIYALPEREQLTNIVFMGQGEPFDNLDTVLKVTQLLMHPDAWAWSPKRITVSTVGVKKGMLRFLDESPCHLAVSLHNPFAPERKEMMPAENAFSLEEFIPMLAERDWSHQRRLSFEYIVFGGQNDTPRHAKELVRLLAPIECRVNLIRFHEIPDSPYQGTKEESIVWLRDYLTQHGVTTTIRASRGQDIWAACGLLNTKHKEAKLTSATTDLDQTNLLNT
ncbi:MAG: 23S rRNA (adenine(2503)-C(2))-methyltransferase RlmN [Bacteroidaceae bacterium]|nr:23S rRNA (adenine(2503)-C(2))-methyltransferase RlmN [Bacteroidaceae bacterium]